MSPENKNAKKVSRREFLRISCLAATGAATIGVANLPNILRFVFDLRFEKIEEQFDDRYGLFATEQAQNPALQEEITGALFKSSGIMAYDDEKSGCSTTFIKKDSNTDTVTLLTAKHCIRQDFSSITISQPQLTNSESIIVPRQNLVVATHPKKDLAIITVKSENASDRLPTISYSTTFLPNRDEYCAMTYPALTENEVNRPVAIRARLERNMLGFVRSDRDGLYQLDSASWFGMSGSGVAECSDTSTIIGVAVKGDFFHDGHGYFEPLDEEVDKMIESAQNAFGK